MPKTKFQEVIFTIIMVFFMVYAMICYNTALNIGEMKNEVFLSAFKELSFMGPIAFILDFFIIGHIAKKLAFKIVNPAKDTRNFCNFGYLYVSSYEPCCHSYFQKCGC